MRAPLLCAAASLCFDLPSSSRTVGSGDRTPINTHIAHVHSCAPSLCGKVNQVAESGAGLWGSVERCKDLSGFCLEATLDCPAAVPSPPSPQLWSENTVNHQSGRRRQRGVCLPLIPCSALTVLAALMFAFIQRKNSSDIFHSQCWRVIYY